MDDDTEIAVVGIGCHFPGGEGLENFWRVLLHGENCAVQIPNERFDLSQWYDPDESKAGKTYTAKAALIEGLNQFDHKFFGITDAESINMDPQQKLLLQCTYRALEDAGIPMEKASGTRTGVFLGLMNKDFEMASVRINPKYFDHSYGTGVAMSIAANRISYIFNFTGPSLAIDCACSSSLVALHFACQAIKQGDCEMAMCAGVSCILEPTIFVSLSKAKMISSDGTSKPFSSKANGYGRGEGCGVVLLKPLKKALKDDDHIWGIISKTAVNQDGHTVSPITKPSMEQQMELLKKIYSTETDLTSVQYIEAHGTGTPVGDPIEAGSISKVIAKARAHRSGPLIIGSVKSNIGHTESAAGVAGLIKVLLMMKHETIVPSLFYSKENSSIDAESLNMKIPTTAEKWISACKSGRSAGINNFGFGGTNAHAVVKQYVQSKIPNAQPNKSHQYFVVSAASEKSMKNIIEDTAKQIIAGKIPDLQSLLYTSACRRSHLKHKYRRVFQTSSLTDLQEKLTAAVEKKLISSKTDSKLVFVFCGNGVTYQGMCKQLLKQEPVFREEIIKIETLLQSHRRLNLIEMLETESDISKELSDPQIVQPLLFAIQVAVVNLLKHWGISPDAVFGHSIGEVAAAHCSGLLSLEDAVKVIHCRSSLQSTVTGGKMLVVSNIAVSEILKMLPAYSGRVCLAAYNSPQSCTLSGDADDIDRLHQNLSKSARGKDLFIRMLDVPAAYHSHKMDPIVSKVKESIGSLQAQDLETELFSTVTGESFRSSDFITGDYWARNIREPVEFEQAVKSAAKNKRNVIFVEIGPRRSLQRYITETLGNEIIVLSSLQPDKDHETILAIVSKLFELGVKVDWEVFYKGFETKPIPYPRYQFDDVKRDVIASRLQLIGPTCNHPVVKQMGTDSSAFSCDLSSDSVAYLQDHRHNGVAIIPGAFYAELGLAATIAHAKPKVPLSSLQLSITFQNPFIFTKNAPEIKVQLDPSDNLADSTRNFKIQSASAVYAFAATSKVVLPAAVCCKAKRFSFLNEIPCVSYLVLAWEILHKALPKAKQQQKLGIFSTVPDSALMKVLTAVANRSGWDVIVSTQSDQLSCDFGEAVGAVLLPPYNVKTAEIAGSVRSIKDIVLVHDKQTEFPFNTTTFKDANDEVHCHFLFLSQIMQKGSLQMQMPQIYRWMKSMHLERKSLSLDALAVQRVKTQDIDLVSVKDSESYFTCQILRTIALNSNPKDQLSYIPVMPKRSLFHKNSVYIVTGGLTGLGFETVKFIAQKGGGNIVILSRSNPNLQMQQEISKLSTHYGSVIKSLPCDVSVSDQVDQTIANIRRLFPSSPIKGVFHSAVVLHDALMEHLDKSLYEKVMRPKVNGVMNLHHATIQCSLDYFVCYSSISAFIGNASQTNYAAANTFLDTFCQYRRNIGLSGQSINWGALNLGLLLDKGHFQRFLEAKGIMLLEIPEILESLEQCLLINKPQHVVCKFNFKNTLNNVLSQNKSLNARLSKIAQEAISKAGVNMSKPEKSMTSSSPRDYLRFTIGETTGVEMDELIDDVHLFDLGIDSMIAMTLQNLIFNDRGVNVPLVTLLDPNSTLSTLIKILEETCVDDNQIENENISTYL
ncbi:hypothetical protein Q8A67_008241 [Cirrhinus molitorella]|uniref:Carrier domain-containing protein n=1 Tax=Cirrhinus molitorella TaxID=172907 RepID=A0AA88Q194_9TELE|nr:hypothetical protein Q8A67_008241 [Cirrhinus molitorella]